MPTPQPVITALQRAAEDLLGRDLNATEVRNLVLLYEHNAGTPSDRIAKTLAEFCNITPELLVEKRSASSNTNRLMIDLQNAIKDQGTPKK